MSGTVPNLCILDGAIVRLSVRKQKETLDSRKRRVFEQLSPNTHYFAIKHSGVWHAYEVAVMETKNGLRTRYSRPLRTLPTEDATAMWLMHKAMRS